MTRKEEYKKIKKLKPKQIDLLDNGPHSLTDSWALNAMWCDWKRKTALHK